MNKEKIGVMGLGTIGLKLVEYLADKGFQVTAWNWRDIKNKQAKFVDSIEKKVKFEKLSYENIDLLKSRAHFTDDFSKLSECDIVIDTLREDYMIKESCYRNLQAIAGEGLLLASSTSSLSLDRLAEAFYPGRFVGLHFFNPPTRMKLIELAFINAMEDHTRGRIYRFLSCLDDKKVIEMPAIQGYIVNRILFVFLNYAIEYKMDSKIECNEIDDAMKAGTNMPMGPLELSDYIGNDITLEILEELYSSLHDDRYKPTELLKKMVADGKLGRKTKKGFYMY